jgi:dihydroorotate dehydrogenase electron transfer subunit
VRRIRAVTSTVHETPSTVTLRFEDDVAAAPGQFVMVWVPGDDELPMSLSYCDGMRGVTVKEMGATSAHITRLVAGERIGIRGPYGAPFDLAPRHVLVVGGGSGTAVLAPAAEALVRAGGAVTVALGATTGPELLFERRLRAIADAIHVATDDGSEGYHGYVTDVVSRLLPMQSFDAVWTCGPEIMMAKVDAAAAQAGVPVWCSVERHMKCAVGICDACALGPYHVCQDGPVFAGAALRALPEFARSHRDPSGRPVGFGPTVRPHESGAD